MKEENHLRISTEGKYFRLQIKKSEFLSNYIFALFSKSFVGIFIVLSLNQNLQIKLTNYKKFDFLEIFWQKNTGKKRILLRRIFSEIIGFKNRTMIQNQNQNS